MGVNAAVGDPIRQNVWATKSLIGFGRGQTLTAEQLEATGVGTYGNILATLAHVVRCDGSYLQRIADSPLDFVDSQESSDFSALERWHAEAGALWEQLLAKPIDVERVIVVDNGT